MNLYLIEFYTVDEDINFAWVKACNRDAALKALGLADLMHFADSKDIDFESSLRMAKVNFEAEQGEKHHGI